ncbi:MAG TPA: TonB-dependent receptor plug domain-containing protein [Tenuifilaceae bacterium]|nr:TonB-dependent receptor plug domain-containing protein [Tenuifilaceae bacterium]
MKRCLVVSLIVLLAASAKGQNKEEDIFNLSLEELLNLEVSISTKTATNIRNTPGILTVITSEDIKNSGVNGIIDLFQLFVPGFDFGVDVEGVVGMGVRGIWAHEGKVLFMVNGLELNDGMFASVPFGNHFPLNNIERIEVIRGPGSAMYGGFAGMGVVNIITRDVYKPGGYVSYTANHTGRQFSQNNVGFGTGVHQNYLNIGISGNYGNGSRSDRDYVDYHGQSRSMRNASDTYTRQLDLKLNYKNFNLVGFIDDYSYQQIDLWDSYYPGPPLTESFKSSLVQATYDFKPNGNLTITPKISYKWQQPWKLTALGAGYGYNNNKTFDGLLGGISTSYTKNKLTIVGGAELKHDHLNQPELVDTVYEETFRNGKEQLSYTNTAIYGLLQHDSRVGNFTLGARYDFSSEYGSSFVPRVGIAKVFDFMHFKVMVSQSFRVPGGILPNRLPQGNPEIKPEKGTSYEVAIGFKMPFQSYITFNIFDVSFDKVIVYNLGNDDITGVGYYKNEGTIGTRGIEADFRHISTKISSFATFAYYMRKHSKTDSLYRVPDRESYFLGFSPLRLNGGFNFRVNNQLSLTLSGSYFGKRYAFTQREGNGMDVLEKLNPLFMLGCNVNIKNIVLKGLTATIEVNNMLGESFVFPQPYKGSHAPLPGLDRSFGFNLVYEY